MIIIVCVYYNIVIRAFHFKKERRYINLPNYNNACTCFNLISLILFLHKTPSHCVYLYCSNGVQGERVGQVFTCNRVFITSRGEVAIAATPPATLWDKSGILVNNWDISNVVVEPRGYVA